MRDLRKKIADLHAQQASAWVAALSRPDDGQRRAFLDWLKESPLNVREFLLAYAIDQSLGQLDASRQVNIDSLLAEAKVSVSRLPTSPAFVPDFVPTATSRSRSWAFATAAGIAVVVLIGMSAKFGRTGDWQEYRTAMGQQETLNLEDGSIVHLSPRSSIAIKVSARERVVKLIEGEALFDVHHDAQRPFQVLTPDAVINDLGTLFNVYSRSDGVKVAVIEGSVSVTAQHSGGVSRMSDSNERVLDADQEANIDHRGVITIGQPSVDTKSGSLQQPRLIYRNETLKHIVDDFNRHGRKLIELEGDDVKGRSYTGVFNTGDPESLAQVLERDPDLIVEQRDDRIVIRAR